MKKKSLGINAILNAIKTALSVIFPLITFPYASRVLGVDNIGIFNFSSSVVSYTALFAALGVKTYAVREGARFRENREQLNTFASEVFTINLYATIVAYIVLFLLCISIPKLFFYRPFIFVLSWEIVFTTIGCDWVYPIFENYFYVTVRLLCVYIISMILLFTFVKSDQDLMKYTMISSFVACGSYAVNIIGRHKLCKIRFTFKCNFRKHLIPILSFFMNAVTTTIYVHSDVLILGFMTSDTFSGIYAVSARIYSIIKQVLAAVITVSVPRLSSYWGTGQKKAAEETCHYIFNALLVLAAPAMVGLLCLSKQVILLISGEAYEAASTSLAILSIALIFSLFCWFYVSCVLIPSKHENEVLQGTVAAAVTNIVLNLLLIPYWQERAAALTTCIAEAVALAVTYYRSINIMRIKTNIRDILSVIIGCVSIVMICKTTILITNFNTLLTLAIAIPFSAITYGIILIIAKNSTVFFLLKKLKKKHD